MKKVLLLGLCPLPTENDTCTLAPGKRTWQFARSLLEDGHRVCMVCSRHLASYKNAQLKDIQAEDHGNLIYYSTTQSVFESGTWLQTIHDRFEPDCIVGATVYPSYIATRLNTDKPVWADLFGHIMAEAQTKSFVFKDNYYLSKLWKMERTILDRADIFSVVSTPQSYATIGELGTRGRLNSSTTGYFFVRIIPCSINDSIVNAPANPHPVSEPILRNIQVRDDDFVILWSGGYNTWTDVNTLFNALERIFSINQKIKFVSTGGQIESHDELTYQHFLNMINHSPYRDHFIMNGWVPFNEVPRYWQEADVGINIDLFSYEAILGSRNRILDWMQAGLPVVTTELCELSQIIRENKLGFTFKPENIESLTACILHLVQQPELLRETAERAKQYVFDCLTISRTTEPLREWVSSPWAAPDRHRQSALETDDLDQARFLTRHYWASIRNQIRYNGLAGTLKWILSRSPFFSRFL